MFQGYTSNPQSTAGTSGGKDLSLVPLGLGWREFPLLCDAWSSEEEEDNDDYIPSTLSLLQEYNISVDLLGEHLSKWALSKEVLVFSRQTAFADRFRERAFLDALARRTTPLAYMRVEHYFPFRWHTPEDFISSLAHVDVGRLVMSNLHFSKNLPVPWMVHARQLELRDCWFDDEFALPSQCYIKSFRISGGFGLDPDSTTSSFVLKVLIQHTITDFGYVVDHWAVSVSSSLLAWIQCNPQLRRLELGTDVVACLTQDQWLKWMMVLANISLETLTLHVGQRYDSKRAVLLRDMLRQNHRIGQVSFVGLSQHVWMSSIASVCEWNRFANGVTALSSHPKQEMLFQVTVQRSQMQIRRLAFVFSQRTDMLCSWVQDLSNVRKRKRPRMKADSVYASREQTDRL